MKRFNYYNPDDSHIFEERYNDEPTYCYHCYEEIKEPKYIDSACKRFICDNCNIIMNQILNK